MVINELPVGSIVRLGRYALGHRPDEMIDIDWIKVSRQNDFIAQKVLLGMQYDALENWNENTDYSYSNIRQFMNSDQHSWFHPTHPHDVCSSYITLDNWVSINISRYSGLLSFFYDEELKLIEQSGHDSLRLPTAAEVMGGFPYFKRYGKRAHPVTQYGELAYDCFRESMFARYYVTGSERRPVCEMDRAGNICEISPAKYSGVRPVCKIQSDAEVIETGKNTYKMNISSTGPVRFFKETQSLDWLLGL